VTINPVDKADLRPTSITHSPITAGNPVTFDSGIENSGIVDSGAFNIKWFLDDVEVVYGSHGAIQTGETVEDGNSAFTWESATSGEHNIAFDVNVDHHFDEPDFDNNKISITVNVP